MTLEASTLLPAPVLFALPCGASLGGVVEWTRAAIAVLCDHNHPVGVILHAPRTCDTPTTIAWPTGTHIFDLTNEPSLDSPSLHSPSPDSPSPNSSSPDSPSSNSPSLNQSAWQRIADRYIAAILTLHSTTQTHANNVTLQFPPVICIPSLIGDCYGLFAHATRTHANFMRLVSLVHSPTAYDRAIASHYSNITAALAAVSPLAAAALAQRVASTLAQSPNALAPDLAPNFTHAAPAVHVIEASVEPIPKPNRDSGAGRSRSLRMVYAGRLDAHAKGVMALPHVVATLGAMGVRHRLAILGDGPAKPNLIAQLIRAKALGGKARLHGVVSRNEVARALAWADVVLLPSRYEGLSMTLLEALRVGCVPVGTSGALGTGDLAVIRDGLEGLIIHEPDLATRDTDRDRLIGSSIACAAAGLIEPNTHDNANATKSTRSHLSTMRRACITLATTRFTRDNYARQLIAFITAAAAAPAATWSPNRPWRFGEFSSIYGSGSTPTHAPKRMHALLSSLQGSRVAIQGTGRHTIDLLPILQQHSATIVGFIDDDLARVGGTFMNLPIVAPDAAVDSLRATDIVVSSWIHEADVLARATTYWSKGIRVHGLYAHASSPCASPEDFQAVATPADLTAA